MSKTGCPKKENKSAAAGPNSDIYAPRASIKVAAEANGPKDLIYIYLSRCYC